MFISRIKLKNWKNFCDVEVKLQERIFIIGANASGKSNFLDIFRFLRDIAKSGGGLQKAVLDRGGISKIRCLAARKNSSVSIEIDISEINSSEESTRVYTYEITINHDKSSKENKVFIEKEKVVQYKKDKKTILVDRPEKKDEKDKERLTQTFLEQINSNKEFREIAKYLEQITYLHLVPQLLKYPNAFHGSDMPDDPFGKGFLEKLAKTPKKNRESYLKNIDKALKIAVPQMEELKYEEDEYGKPHLTCKYNHWRKSGSHQNEEQFSDGTLRMIGFLWSIQEDKGLLLLEEPELSLNAKIIAQIPGIIYKIQKKQKRQIILTSHSADLLQDRGISLHEVIILQPSSEGTKIISAYDIEDVRAMLEGNCITVGEAILPKISPHNIQKISLDMV